MTYQDPQCRGLFLFFHIVCFVKFISILHLLLVIIRPQFRTNIPHPACSIESSSFLQRLINKILYLWLKIQNYYPIRKHVLNNLLFCMHSIITRLSLQFSRRQLEGKGKESKAKWADSLYRKTNDTDKSLQGNFSA